MGFFRRFRFNKNSHFCDKRGAALIELVMFLIIMMLIFVIFARSLWPAIYSIHRSYYIYSAFDRLNEMEHNMVAYDASMNNVVLRNNAQVMDAIERVRAAMNLDAVTDEFCTAALEVTIDHDTCNVTVSVARGNLEVGCGGSIPQGMIDEASNAVSCGEGDSIAYVMGISAAASLPLQKVTFNPRTQNPKGHEQPVLGWTADPCSGTGGC